MAKTITEKFVRKAIIDWLSKQGYNRYLKEKQSDEHGVDISVRHWKYARYYLVEAKGDADPKTVKFPRSRQEVSFMIAVGQIVTRMKTKARYNYAIAFPYSYGFVLRRVPWLFCKKNNLKILLVSLDKKVKQYSWQDLEKIQKK